MKYKIEPEKATSCKDLERQIKKYNTLSRE